VRTFGMEHAMLTLALDPDFFVDMMQAKAPWR